jgi:hypothetical protein
MIASLLMVVSLNYQTDIQRLQLGARHVANADQRTGR